MPLNIEAFQGALGASRYPALRSDGASSFWQLRATNCLIRAHVAVYLYVGDEQEVRAAFAHVLRPNWRRPSDQFGPGLIRCGKLALFQLEFHPGRDSIAEFRACLADADTALDRCKEGQSTKEQNANA